MRKRLLTVLGGIFLCMILLFLYYFFVEHFHFGIPCPIHSITGYYCPGCGITRCLFSILQLDFYQAFRYNMAVFILLPFITLGVIISAYYYIVDKKYPYHVPNYIYISLIVLLILFGILRNIDTFSFLAPTTIP